MTMLDPRTRDDLVNEATAEHRTIPRSRTVLVELAARYLLAGIVARARGDDCGVLQARAKILGIAAVFGHPQIDEELLLNPEDIESRCSVPPGTLQQGNAVQVPSVVRPRRPVTSPRCLPRP